MQKNNLVFLLIFLAGIVVVGGYYLKTRPAPVEPEAAEATQEETAPAEETAEEETAASEPEETDAAETAEPAPEETAPKEGPIAADTAGPFLAITVSGEAAGTITIDLFEQVAPNHVARITALAEAGQYDGVVFHRVIDGFMAQTGDVQYGRADEDRSRVGQGGSDQPDLEAEFSDVAFGRGMVGMARSQNPDSANSQFFIMFAPGDHLNGQYTVVGQVTEGLEVLDAIKRGASQSGVVQGEPDVMQKVTVTRYACSSLRDQGYARGPSSGSLDQAEEGPTCA